MAVGCVEGCFDDVSVEGLSAEVDAIPVPALLLLLLLFPLVFVGLVVLLFATEAGFDVDKEDGVCFDIEVGFDDDDDDVDAAVPFEGAAEVGVFEEGVLSLLFFADDGVEEEDGWCLDVDTDAVLGRREPAAEAEAEEEEDIGAPDLEGGLEGGFPPPPPPAFVLVK